VIEMKNITRYYGNFRALNDISFTVNKGEILGLLGPNGAGKTTAMRILTSFLPATSGTATVAGFDVFEESYEVRRRLGYLPETPPLYLEMTVESYLNFVAEIKEIPGRIRRPRIRETAARLGLEENLGRVIGHLSKGFRQRVGIAQAMLHNPEVLILDEPTVGLDPNQIIEIRHLIKDLASDHTIILSTHYLAEVSMTCVRVVIINEGEIVAVDTVANLERFSSGKPMWKIAIKPGNDQNFAEKLKKITTATTAQCSELQIEEGISRFNLEMETEEDFDEFFRQVSSAGAIFRQISPVRASLEDVFLKLTSNEEKRGEE